MENIVTVISSVVVSGLSSAALIWLARNWISERLKSSIKHEYDQKLEAYRTQLESEADISIERLKSQLQIAAAERNVRFSRIFERTAEITAETYAKLLAFNDAVGHYTTPIETGTTPPMVERRQVVSRKFNDLWDYVRPNRLFLPKETAKRIDEFQRRLHAKAFEFMVEVEEGSPRTNRPNQKVWMDTVDFMNKEAVPLLELLEDDFRKILGTVRDDQTISTPPAATPASQT